ncbi:hypothetical protein [Streptomyces sp. I05A-00742]|uniref:hypothetical protein n=1 Tax=Streptomyces sp. I05A-00742 TaxID=2732853 RepID=UPI001488E6B5|nr:hypothetical protein [Streptomyces sp. I05A-00742]
MKNSIARLLAWTRAQFGYRAAPETPVTPVPRESPVPAPAPAPELFRPRCGVYIWATAHGIDIRPTSPLHACTCSGETDPAADTDRLRAKVREVNARGTWGR